jgi:amidase
VRGEGRFQLAVMTTSPWDDAYDITIAPEARAALDVGVEHLAAIGHGIESIALEPAPDYARHFRTIWQAGAATIPADGEQLELLEPLTRWLVERGRALGARQLAEALAWLSGYERSVIRQFSRVDAVVTPTLAMTPRPVGWYDREDGERNFAQQVQYTPFTSFVNVCGLPGHHAPGAPDGRRPADGAAAHRAAGWRGDAARDRGTARTPHPVAAPPSGAVVGAQW